MGFEGGRTGNAALRGGLDLDLFSWAGDVHLEPLSGEPLCQGGEGVVFPVYEEGPGGMGLHDPTGKLFLVGMGGKAVDGPDIGLHGHLLPEHTHALGPVHDGASQGSPGLVTHEHHPIFLSPQAMAQVMEDPPPGAHTTPGDDHVAPSGVIEALGFLRGSGDAKGRKTEWVFLPQEKALPFLVEPVRIPGEGAGDPAPKRGIEHDVCPRGEIMFLPQKVQDVQHLLGASKGEEGMSTAPPRPSTVVRASRNSSTDS